MKFENSIKENKSIFEQILYVAKKNNVKIIKSKNGFFFYKDLIKKNRGYFKITYNKKSKKLYHTGYKNETYISNNDIVFLDEDFFLFWKNELQIR